MRVSLITKAIWAEIKKTVKGSRSKNYVSIAYFGKGGAELLPLKEGDVLVVDASDIAVKCGQTSPFELLKLYKKKVNIYSYPLLHAKIFLLDKTIFIGSTNVSNNSVNNLKEAVVKIENAKVFIEAKKFVQSIAISELGFDRLTALTKIYHPPKFSEPRKNTKAKRGIHSEQPCFYIFRVRYADYSEGYELPLKKGLVEAKKRHKKKRHIIQEFQWSGSINIKQGDLVVQITKEADEEWVSPPGTVLSFKKWNTEKKHSLVFLEIPDKKVKNLNSIKRKFPTSFFQRSGRKNIAFAGKFTALWN